MTGEGVYIYEKSNVKVTGIIINSFSEGISVLLSHSNISRNIISGIQHFSNRIDGFFGKLNGEHDFGNTLGGSTIGITIGTSEKHSR